MNFPFKILICCFVLSNLEAGDQRLVIQLSSGMTEERSNAAYLLGMSEDPGIVGLILNQLSEEPVKENKLVMIESIRKLNVPEGYDGLSQFYRGESDPEVKRKAVQVLGESGQHKFVALIEESLTLSDPTDQKQALTALSHIKHPSATKALFQYLIAQKARQKRDWALTAIAAQKRKEAVKPLIHLGNQTKDSDERARIAEVLGEIGDSQAQETLLLWYQETQGITSKKRMVKSLGQAGSSRLMGSLFKELSVNGMSIQIELIQAMVTIDREAALPYLETFYKQQMDAIDPHQPRMEAMTAIRLHRLLRDLLEIEGDPSESYPEEWRADPILNHLIAS